jgi:tetratricopeptide (TPR) repeat protein
MDPSTGKQRYRLPKKWEASSHYSKTLRQVRQQVTPAGQYREYYKAFGREEAVIRLLDRRIDPQVDKCRTAVTCLQARQRGWKGRQYFLSVRDALIDARMQREIRRDALAFFRLGDKRASLDTILQYRGPSLGLGLYVMKCKLYYGLGEIDQCMKTARGLVTLDPTHLDGNYLLACCLVAREQYEAAFQLLSTLFSESPDATQVGW